MLTRKVKKKQGFRTFLEAKLVNLSLGGEKSSNLETERKRVPYLLASTECCL